MSFLVRPFKNVHEQLNILHNRGLKLTDYQNNKLYLMTNNYYSIINGYSRYFWQTTNKYFLGTTFDDISMLYFLDRELKFIFLKAILEAEKHIKSITAYTLAEKYKDNPTDYLSTDFYTYDSNSRNQSRDVTFLVNRFQKIISKYNRQLGNNPIKNHQRNHGGIPFWVMVEHLTFGELKLVIKYLPAIQNTIAKRHYTFISEKMAIQSFFTGNVLLSFIENIFEIRNICAHDSRLLDFKCKNNLVYFPTLHDRYGILPNSPRSDVYNTFLTLQCFLSKTQYAILHNTVLKRLFYLDNYLSKRGYPIHTNTILSTLGFPDNWHVITMKLPQ
ncbi:MULTISPECIES: Abi family protein [Streptococcus]|uniref:Abi-like protein n=1 Tax=Streptococcus anginosus F0211 TaxID=706437 RepID=E6IZF6_STRAP|nr:MULTISPECIES: Abi family protein [Streptococcus]EFU23045.1 Abi-like protein [Streptococcus anginosus F0211]MCY7213022.1 Abi family protein [Streptococcus anginosus]MDX5005811.1 Abi family protein [Streptococcus anginosus]MDX5053891.1 Abi family protein [Streptococcus anginosus]OFL62150.1 DNA-binding protein [Streptococcus sp. HMSC061D01]